MGFIRRVRKNMTKKAQTQQQVDYQLHLAQQIEILNQNLELLKNNVYGQSQVEIVLYALSTGSTEDAAIKFSLDLIDNINKLNAERMDIRRKEFEQKMAEKMAAQSTNSQENSSEGLSPAVA